MSAVATAWNDGVTWLRTAWGFVKDPRATRITFFVVYLLMLNSGLNAVFDPPSSIATEFGDVVTAVWAALLTAGGAIGAASVLQGWNFLERVAVWAAISGAGIYAAVVFTLHFTAQGQRMTQFGFVAGMFAVFIWRLWETRGPLIEPRG